MSISLTLDPGYRGSSSRIMTSSSPSSGGSSRASCPRSFILAAIERWLEKPAQLPVVRIVEGKRPAVDAPSFFMEMPRIILVLKGRATFVTVEHGNETVFDVLPGQILYLAEQTWICVVPKASYESLGVIFHKNSTRFTVHARKIQRTRGVISENTSRYLHEWQSIATLGERGAHLHALLKESAPERLGDETHCAIARILFGDLADLVEHSAEQPRMLQSICWQSVCDYLSDHWSDPSLSRHSAAQFFHCHPNHFSRFFHSNANCNFRAYINDLRLRRSFVLLRNLQYNVTEVAALCGFTDLQYFIRCFRQRYEFTPGHYRKRYES